MPNPKRSLWTNCSMAGLLGFFLMTGRRNRRGQDDDAAPTPSTDSPASASATTSGDVSQTQAVISDRPNPQRSSNMTSPLDEIRRAFSKLTADITPRQWAIAASVLVGIPVVAFIAAVFIYPYAQDLLDGESPIDAVLAEYGVAKDAETQLLTIRRGDLVNSVNVNGTLEYANRERLSFGTAGTIDTIEVEVGDFVSEGDVLMSLESEAIVSAEQDLKPPASPSKRLKKNSTNSSIPTTRPSARQPSKSLPHTKPSPTPKILSPTS